MEAKRVPVGFKLLIFTGLFAVFCWLLQSGGEISNEQLSIWRNAATLFRDDDPEGFILLSTFLTNLVLAVADYKWVVRCLEKRMNEPG